MPKAVAYAVHAPPERVLDAIIAATMPGSAIGFSLTDGSTGPLIGSVRADGSFDVRRPRGLATVPRVVVARGSVRESEPGTVVTVRYEFHPAARLTRALWVLLALPFEWLARADRAVLRTDLEAVLRRAGAVATRPS